MIGDDLDTPPLKYSPIRYLGLPLFVRILPYFLSSCRPEYRWRNWLLACAHVGLVDVGGVGAGQRFMCLLRKSQHPLNTTRPVSRCGVALWEPPPPPPTPPGPFPGWDGLDHARGKTCRLLAALLLAEFALTKLQLCFAFRPAWVSEKGAGFFWVGKNIPFFLWGRWYLCFSEKKFLDNNILLYALDVWDKRTIFKQSVSLLKCCQKGQEGIQPRRNLFQI